MVTTILTWAIAIILSVGVGLAVIVLLSGAGNIGVRWWRGRTQSSLASLVAGTTRMESTEPSRMNEWRMPKAVLWMGGAEILLAIFITMRGGALIGAGTLASLAVIVLYARKRNSMAELAKLTDQTEELLSEYYSRWLLNASPFGVLEDIVENTSFGQPMDAILQQVMSRYRLGEPDALAPLRGTDPYLQQFGYILAQTARSGNRVTAAAINETLKRLQMRHRLKKRVDSATALVRSEEIFLLVANATAFIVAAVFPLLQEFYTSNAARQLILAVAIVIVTLGGIYFDYEIESLKEKAL